MPGSQVQQMLDDLRTAFNEAEKILQVNVDRELTNKEKTHLRSYASVVNRLLGWCSGGIQLPCAHQPGDQVRMVNDQEEEIKLAEVKDVIFSEGKVVYNLEIQINGVTVKITDVDSIYVKPIEHVQPDLGDTP